MSKLKKAVIGGLLIASITPSAYAKCPNNTKDMLNDLFKKTDINTGLQELFDYINRILGCENGYCIIPGATATPACPAATAEPKKTEQPEPVTEPATEAPTQAPTAAPTAAPTSSPTERPTASPTAKPTTAPTAAPTAKPVAASSASAIEREVLELVNAERAKYGLSALTWADDLASVARAHSKDMIDRGFFDHTNPDGRSPFDRLRLAGISYRTAAENIAYGQRTPEAVMQAWMNSSGHRANILNANVKEIGVGAVTSQSGTIYWTQLFVAR